MKHNPGTGSTPRKWRGISIFSYIVAGLGFIIGSAGYGWRHPEAARTHYPPVRDRSIRFRSIDRRPAERHIRHRNKNRGTAGFAFPSHGYEYPDGYAPRNSMPRSGSRHRPLPPP